MNKKTQAKQSFRLVSSQVAENCFKAIQKAVAENTKHHVIVTIGVDNDKTRSLAQNRLYWSWVHILAEKQGLYDDELHLYFKRKFLALIYARDDGEMLETIESLQTIKNTMPNLHYERIARNVAKGIRSSQANTKQFNEYLNNIEQWAYAQGYPPLPIPDDLRWVRDER